MKRHNPAELREAVVLVPLNYNDGTRVRPSLINEFLNELYATFDGWTAGGEVKGAYRMQSGRKQVDKLLQVSVILQVQQIALLEEMIARWCGELKQEVMLLKITQSAIKFIPSRPRENGS